MLFYFILFTLLGVAIKHVVPNKMYSLLGIIVFSLIWGMYHAPVWGLVTMAELFLGFIGYDVFRESKWGAKTTSNTTSLPDAVRGSSHENADSGSLTKK